MNTYNIYMTFLSCLKNTETTVENDIKVLYSKLPANIQSEIRTTITNLEKEMINRIMGLITIEVNKVQSAIPLPTEKNS